jgi:hypothetical protein
MHGHGHDGVGLRDQLAARAAEPQGKQPRQVYAVGVLELQDQVARMVVVQAARARAKALGRASQAAQRTPGPRS